MSTAEALDLSRLAAFSLVSADYGALLAEHKEAYRLAWEQQRQRNPNLPSYDVGNLQFDPVTIAIQETSTRRMLDRQALNDAGKRLTLAFSDGDYLEHLAVTYHRTERLVLKPAETNLPAVMERDDEYRLRAQLAPEATPQFGITRGGYVYAVRSHFPQIRDVMPIRRGGGAIEIRLLGRDGDGAVDNATLAAVIRLFQGEGASQSTDIVSVFPAEIDHVDVALTLLIPRGPDPAAIVEASRQSLLTYRDEVHHLNGRIYSDALTASAKIAPVMSVQLDPGFVPPTQRREAAPYIDTINIGWQVVDG